MGAADLKPWKPGQSGNPGGRPKKFLTRPDQELHALGISPVAEILALMPDLRASDQLKAWLELLSYCAAKPKEIPVDDLVDYHSMSDGELIQLVREKLPALEKKE